MSIVPDSEKIYVNQILMTKLSNYTIDYKEGKIKLLTTTETWIGTNTTTVFYTAQKPIVPDSEKVYVNKTLMTKPWEYAIDYDKGEITFATTPDLGVEIKVAYQYPPALGAEIKAIYLYNGVVNGDLIVGGSAQFMPGPFDNVAGELSLTVGVFQTGGEVTSGPGTLANVTFTVVGYGASDITIDSEPLARQSKLVGWNWFGDPTPDYDIINAVEHPDQIQHGYFRNIPPVHDVAVSLVAPEEAVVGQLVAINVTVANMGTYHENVTLTVSYDDTPINTTVIDMLPPLESEVVEFSWDTSTGVAEDNYTITAEANIPLDDLPVNNNETRLITLTLVRDVAVVNVTIAPAEPIVGQLVAINVTVENHGGYSEDFKVEFTCNVTIRHDIEIVYTSESQSSVTPPMGDSTTLSFNWNTTGINPVGYFITAEAILTEDVDQENNVFKKKISVTTSLGTIWGIVTDSSTGDPISGANVTADTVASDLTKEDGSYWITDLEHGNYTVTASAAGYQTSSETITVLPGESTSLDFELTLLLNGTISGIVTDSSTGDPISEATVTANGMSTTTNSSGHYAISDVPAGTYTVTASANGYEDSSQTNITVVAGETTTVDFELTPTQPLDILLYAGVAAAAIIVIAGIAIYILKVRKPT